MSLQWVGLTGTEETWDAGVMSGTWGAGLRWLHAEGREEVYAPGGLTGSACSVNLGMLGLLGESRIRIWVAPWRTPAPEKHLRMFAPRGHEDTDLSAAERHSRVGLSHPRHSRGCCSGAPVRSPKMLSWSLTFVQMFLSAGRPL